MTLLGLNIEVKIDKFPLQSLKERLTSKVIKKDEERKAFLEFLDSRTLGGTTVFEEIENQGVQESKCLNTADISSEEINDFVISELKARQNGRINLYEFLVYRTIAAIDPRLGKVDLNQIPPSFPVVHNKATAFLQAKIKDGISENTKYQYLQRKILEDKLRSLAKEMFFGVNKLNLEKEELVRYLNIVYEVGKIREAEEILPHEFRFILAKAIKKGEPIELVHVKCLRFVYPKEGGVRILTDTKDVVIEGVNGRYIPKSEENLFSRLKKIKDIFSRNSLTVDFHIVLADEDLDLLFPQGNKYVDYKCKEEGDKNIQIYLQNLKAEYSDSFEFTTINLLAGKAQGTYQKFEEEIYRDLIRFGGRFIDPHFFERDRVNHQYEYYRKLFGDSYSREEARRSISAQVASYIALEKILKLFGNNCILIEENRGGENKIIANGKVPIIFTKLRDEAKFGVQ